MLTNVGLRKRQSYNIPKHDVSGKSAVDFTQKNRRTDAIVVEDICYRWLQYIFNYLFLKAGPYVRLSTWKQIKC